MWLPLGGIVNAIEAIDPDVVHLHWICGGMIRIEDLGRIKKPIIWSLHDIGHLQVAVTMTRGVVNIDLAAAPAQCWFKTDDDLSHNIFIANRKPLRK
jgi:hypothetical protein